MSIFWSWLYGQVDKQRITELEKENTELKEKLEKLKPTTIKHDIKKKVKKNIHKT